MDRLIQTLIMSDVFWGVAVAVYVLIAVPTLYLVMKRKKK